MFEWEKLVNHFSKSLNEYQKERRVANQKSAKLLLIPYNILTDAQKEKARLQLMIKQNGCCAICGIAEKNLNRRLSIDHCHKTNEIRGLLCFHCNSLIGFAKENTNILQSSITYLNSFLKN